MLALAASEESKGVGFSSVVDLNRYSSTWQACVEVSHTVLMMNCKSSQVGGNLSKDLDRKVGSKDLQARGRF